MGTQRAERSASASVEASPVTAYSTGKGIDHPAVLACIEMFVDAGNTDGAALFVAQREEGCALSPGGHIGILADIKRAVGAGEKRTHKAMHILSGDEIFRRMRLTVRAACCRGVGWRQRTLRFATRRALPVR